MDQPARPLTPRTAGPDGTAAALARRGFDGLCALARAALEVPVAQVVRATEGPWLGAGSDWAVEDIAADPRLAVRGAPVAGPGLRAFAGVPLMLRDGRCGGSFCVADRQPRRFSAAQRQRLREFAAVATALLDLEERDGAALAARAAAEQAAAAAAQSEQQWRTMVERGVETVICWSATGRQRRYVSPSCRDLLGYGTAEMLSISYRAMVRPEHLAQVEAGMAALCLGETDRSQSTYQLRHKNGGWVWVDACSRLVRDADGSPMEVFTTLRDASERLATEEQLRGGEARSRALADSLPQMMWVIAAGQDFAATYTNAQFRDFYGEIAADRRSRTACNHPQDAEAMHRAWAEALREERAYSVEGRIRRYDGVYRWHRLVCTPVKHDGVLREWICTALDIDDLVTAREALEHSTAFLRLAQGAAGAGLWDWEFSTDRLHHVSPSAPGAEARRRTLTLARAYERIAREDHGVIKAQLDVALRTREPFTAEFRMANPQGGRTRWIQAIGRVVHDTRTGQPLRMVGLHLDISARRQAEDALRRSEGRLRTSEERLALALDSADEGLWDINMVTGEVWVSDRWFTVLGFRPGETAPNLRCWRRSLHPDDAGRVVELLRDHLAGRAPSYECENRFRRKDGSYGWFLVRGRVVSRDATGRPLRMVGTQFEISRRKAAEARVEHLALHDALTGLPNRVLFRERLNEVYRRGGGEPRFFAILCLDLDRFKEVNDTLGHPAGDVLLRLVAGRIGAVIGPENTTARLGGDEFVVLMPKVARRGDVEALAQHLVAAIAKPLEVEGRPVHVGTSIGIALGPGHGDDADALFKNADIALYKAKAGGRNTWRFYEPGMDAAIAHRKQLEGEMRDALRNNGFTLHFQPVLALGARDTVVGFEALLRWQHPQLGAIAPAAMIPLAEETGLIVPLGAWVLLQACHSAMAWPDASLRVAVNVSAVQFRDAGLEENVVLALMRSGLAPHRLELEVTESVLMQNGEAVLGCLHRLRRLGVRIALDDFGTGFSSLSYLRRFPFDKIKVDRSFTGAIAEAKTAAIVSAVIGLGQPLGAAVTAEGVETADQRTRLMAMGCDEVQGFLFSPPLPAGEVAGYLEREAASAAA